MFFFLLKRLILPNETITGYVNLGEYAMLIPGKYRILQGIFNSSEDDTPQMISLEFNYPQINTQKFTY